MDVGRTLADAYKKALDFYHEATKPLGGGPVAEDGESEKEETPATATRKRILGNYAANPNPGPGEPGGPAPRVNRGTTGATDEEVQRERNIPIAKKILGIKDKR